jgi:DNA-binding IclR family transcriptional regulator
VARTVDLLRLVAESAGNASGKELAAAAKLPAPSAHRLLALLIKEAMVVQDPVTKRYAPGIEFSRQAALVLRHRSIADIARPFMERLVDRSEEACLLGQYLGDGRMMFVDEVPSRDPLGYRIEKYVPSSVAWGASGRSMLASLDDKILAVVVRRGEPAPGTGASMPSRKSLRGDLEVIRERGFAFTTEGHRIANSVGIAAPVRGREETVLGCLCMTIPAVRFEPGSEQELGALIVAAASDLSDSLGHRDWAVPPGAGLRR